MKTLYIDCGMGAAGDMLTAALLELLPEGEQAAFLARLNALGLPGVTVRAEKVSKCGILGTHIAVLVDGSEEADVLQGHSHEHFHEHSHGHGEDAHMQEHSHEHTHHTSDEAPSQEAGAHSHGHTHPHGHHHSHSGMHDITHIVEGLPIPEEVQKDVLAVYRLIAEAEGHVHGRPMEEIHFHEVGTKDAVMDVTAVCLLMHMLSPDEVVASPVHVGAGEVRCAHGILPVPAPATAYILRDVPIYGGEVRSELCTPTGAALLKHFVTRFADLPVLRVHAIGYGMGKRDLPRANCVRVLLGETEGQGDTMRLLSCNVDDMTAEEIGFAMEKLFMAGAREVYTAAVGMKKSRPGTLIRVLCDPERRDGMLALLFRHTATLGVREIEVKRHVLTRREEAFESSYGVVHRKHSSGYGVTRVKYEYEDLRRIAEAEGISLWEARERVERELK